MPSAHIAEAERLSASVHAALDPAEVVPDTPFVFREPLGTYQHLLSTSERILTFLGLSYMTDDEQQLNDSIARLDPEFWPVVDRHLNVSGLIDAGVRRGYALDPESFRHLEGKISPIRNDLLALLANR